jgi:hypothetical protein
MRLQGPAHTYIGLNLADCLLIESLEGKVLYIRVSHKDQHMLA